MRFTYTCPSCRSESTFHAPTLPRVAQCSCQAISRVDAPTAAAAETVPVTCEACHHDRDVPVAFAGQAFDCHCGRVVCVPFYVTADPATDDATVRSTEPQNAVVGGRDDVRQRNGKAAATQAPRNHPEITPDTKKRQAKNKSTSESASQSTGDTAAPPRRKLPRFEIAMATSVVAFLGVAVVMYSRRQENAPESKDRRAASSQASSTRDVYRSVAQHSADDPKMERIDVPDGPVDANSPKPSSVGDSASRVERRRQPSQSQSHALPNAGVAAASPVSLPTRVPPRPRIEVTPVTDRALTFDATYRRAFDAYERALEAMQDQDPEIEETVDEYHDALSDAIAWMEICLRRVPADSPTQAVVTNRSGAAKRKPNSKATSNSEATQVPMPDDKTAASPVQQEPEPEPSATQRRNEIRYLLAYLNYLAGRLPEAAVYGQSVARWGDPTESSTREAAMIALAALQEANGSHWGIPREVGELDQMAGIADLIESRWPGDAQADTLNLSLAESYAAFGYPEKALPFYVRVGVASKHFATARLAAARIAWKLFQARRATSVSNSGVTASDVSPQVTLENVEAWLEAGAAKLTKQLKQADAEDRRKAITKTLVATKITWAQVAMRRDRPKVAIGVLSNGPAAPVDAIGPAASNGDTPAGYQLPTANSALVYQTLAAAYAATGDTDKAASTRQAIENLSPEYAARARRSAWSAVTQFAKEIEAQKKLKPAGVKQLKRLSDALVLTDDTVPITQVFWLAKRWTDVADRVESATAANQARRQAVDVYQTAIGRDDFPAEMNSTIGLQIATLHRQSGDHARAIVAIGGVLAETPNAVEQQYDAAESLYQLATESVAAKSESAASDARAAITGRPGTAIWGWYRVAQVVYSLPDSAPDRSEKNDRLRWAQLRIAQCQRLVADHSSDAAERDQMRRDLKKQLSRLQPQSDSAPPQWRKEFRKLVQTTGDAEG